MVVGIVSIIAVMMIIVYSIVSKMNTNASGSRKATDIAVQAADAGINQFISDVSNRQINIIGP